MVCATVMEWLRTPLTIFRQAAWVETCCYAPKVWYFWSRARSTSYCLTVNSFWNSFSYFYLLSNSCRGLIFLRREWLQSQQNVQGCSALSLFLSHYQLPPLTAPSLLFFHSRLRFVSTSVASPVLAGRCRIYRDCCGCLYKPWLLALISWVVYCIDVFLP